MIRKSPKRVFLRKVIRKSSKAIRTIANHFAIVIRNYPKSDSHFAMQHRQFLDLPIYIHIYIHIHIHTHKHTYIIIHLYACIRIYIYAYIHAYIYTYKHACTHTINDIYLYIKYMIILYRLLNYINRPIHANVHAYTRIQIHSKHVMNLICHTLALRALALTAMARPWRWHS